jgi:hypothetical protein
MKITVYDENAFSMDHPRGTVSFNCLLLGDRSNARRLTVVLSGDGTVGDTEIARLGAVEADAGEQARYTAEEELILYTVGLPPIRLPRVPSDQFDEIVTDGGIEYENPADGRDG